MIGIHWRREKLIDYYLIGALSKKQQKLLEAHLKICESCREMLERERQFDQMISNSDYLQGPTEEFREKLHTQIMALPSYKKEKEKPAAL